MDYFLLKQSGTVTVPKAPKTEDTSLEDPSVRIIHDIPSLQKFDYIAGEHLISDRLKQLLEQYLPEQLWRPCVFVDTQTVEQITFAEKAPGLLHLRGSKGMSFLVVHLSVAESILRRGICGLELLRLTD